MEQHSYETHTESKPGYIPVIVIVAILGILAWTLLHHYSPGKSNGYLWQAFEKANPEMGEGAENHNGHEEHGGPESLQEPKHGGEMMTASAATGTLDTLTGNFIYETGAIEDINLADTVSISAGANSSEARLVQFLKSGESVDTADKTKGWITLDRFYFETGSAKITTASQTQLKNIAAILKQFPGASLKIGGYTDNSGNAASNMTLSTSRATAAKNALIALGIPASRLQAEGYGQEHAIADNETAENKARNRRVDVRVIKK